MMKLNRGRITFGILVFISSLLLGSWSFAHAMGHPPKKEPQYKLEILKVELMPASPTFEATKSGTHAK